MPNGYPRSVVLLLLAGAGAWGQKGPHAGMGRPGISRPARPERSAQAPKNPRKEGQAGTQEGVVAPLAKLDRMTPDERRKALEGLPPQRQQQIERRLNQYQQLPPEERQKLLDRKKRFDELPPEKQAEVRQVARQVSELPPNRRGQVRGELNLLRNMPESERRARMNGEEFRSKYSPAEQQMIREASSILPE
ncbi:MAG: DUF3106 domain-containing protein [Acidobacteriota bacterium]|nr:DUF3106 domain-containing protein [Acidobacteriota bacterium]